MLVHPVVIPGSGTRSWTVLGDDDVPVVPVERFLAYLTDIGRNRRHRRLFPAFRRSRRGRFAARVAGCGAVRTTDPRPSTRGKQARATRDARLGGVGGSLHDSPSAGPVTVGDGADSWPARCST